ncbi:hypothetical protein BKA63DRAFT_567850 [Paraphoma chrysanthemicola]|nr:hypothetical protein BKA63DRAFT_567850 [Paraphoma chrysanthemicola]
MARIPDATRFPPLPAGQTKKDKKKARKELRKAANVPLPQSDDADLIVQNSEQDPPLRGEEPVSNQAGPSGLQEAQMVDADTSAPVETQVSEPASEAAEDHESEAAEPATSMEVDAPAPPWFPFRDTSLSLQERVSYFNRWSAELKALRKQWHEDGRPDCESCGGKHVPPCLNKEEQTLFKVISDEGKDLRAEFSAMKTALRLPIEEMLEGEAVMGRSNNGFTEWKDKATLCKLCARWHVGAKNGCSAPFCTKGCGLNHFPTEACGAAVKRFKNLKLMPGGGEGEEEEEKPKPAPSPAMASGSLNETFAGFLAALPNDPDVLRGAAGLYSNMIRKRPAEQDESPEKADSDTKREKKRKKEKKESKSGRDKKRT